VFVQRLSRSAAKLPPIRFHDLRRSAASVSLAESVDLVEISNFLGYSELRITADLYTHLQQQTSMREARIMDSVLRRH
jgi:integrase